MSEKAELLARFERERVLLERFRTDPEVQRKLDALIRELIAKYGKKRVEAMLREFARSLGFPECPS